MDRLERARAIISESEQKLVELLGDSERSDAASARSWKLAAEYLIQLLVLESSRPEVLLKALALELEALTRHGILTTVGVEAEVVRRASDLAGDPDKLREMRVPLDLGIGTGEHGRVPLERVLDPDRMRPTLDGRKLREPAGQGRAKEMEEIVEVIGELRKILPERRKERLARRDEICEKLLGKFPELQGKSGGGPGLRDPQDLADLTRKKAAYLIVARRHGISPNTLRHHLEGS